ncbi:MAG: sugar phosphate nucleotidyltransferase, partial [Cetobacterium sp.]
KEIYNGGGSGERFWPLSTPTKPKQLLSLFSDKSMIRETVDRILPIISADKIFVATNILQAAEIKKELPDIPKENIIIEPAFKDTAAEAHENSSIVTLGIKPDKPETGYGYIEVNNSEPLKLDSIYKVKRFCEKPNKETAEQYLLSGKYL